MRRDHIRSLLLFSLAIASKHSSISANIGKIPFLLIEDLLEGLVLADAENMWTVIESLTDQLTHPDLFAKGIANCYCR